MVDIGEKALNLRVPPDVLRECIANAERLSKAGVKVPWSRAALAALRAGNAAIAAELDNGAAPAPGAA